jgi:hypothetical protein
MPLIEGNGIAGEQTPHDGGDGGGTGPQQQMEMIRNERPGEAGSGSIKQNTAEPFQEIVPVLVITENAFSFNPSADDMMKGTGRIDADAGLAWHDKE